MDERDRDEKDGKDRKSKDRKFQKNSIYSKYNFFNNVKVFTVTIVQFDASLCNRSTKVIVHP